MECCQCDKEIDLEKVDTYLYDYMGDVWCNACMKEEVDFALDTNYELRRMRK